METFDFEGGAFVQNSGSKPLINCTVFGNFTHDGSIVVTPSGNWKLDCVFKGLTEGQHTIRRDWTCRLCLPGQGCEYTRESLYVRTKYQAHSYCHFNGNLRWEG